MNNDMTHTEWLEWKYPRAIALSYDSEGNSELVYSTNDTHEIDAAYAAVNGLMRKRKSRLSRLFDWLLDKVFGREYPLYN